MTLNGAIMELVMLSEHPIMPAIFKPSIQKIIETVSECAEPERKTGRWIYDNEAYPGGNPYGHYDCDQCGESVHHKTNFCPNCGCKMEVEHGTL